MVKFTSEFGILALETFECSGDCKRFLLRRASGEGGSRAPGIQTMIFVYQRYTH